MDFNATFLICTISFIVFVFIMNQILYKPVAKIVAEREKYINDNEQSAADDTDKANELIKNKEEKVQTANKEAGKIILEKSNSAKEEKADMLNKAQESLRQNIEANKNLLIQEKTQSTEKIADGVQNMADIIVKKFLKEGE